MCGRFVTGTDEHDWRSWATTLGLLLDLPAGIPAAMPEAWIPTASVPIVRRAGAGLVLERARWGLMPSWMKQPLAQPPQYNVRVETAPQRFKKYIEQRRCVLPASGFWVRREDGEGRVFAAPAAGGLTSLAGLWTEREVEGVLHRSCTILTVEAAPELGRFHDRMPVVLAPARARRWLEAEVPSDELLALCAEQPALVLS